VNTYDWFKENLTKLSTIEGYNPADRQGAMNTLMQHDDLVTGIIYQDAERPSYQEMVKGYSDTPLSEADLNLGAEAFDQLVKEFM
jgi:2-oxoglutarate ferredoxin oxidoreductase subunit beta